MGALLVSHIRVKNVKLISEKNYLNITELPIIIRPGVAQAYSKVVVTWTFCPRDENLLYLCLGTTNCSRDI